MRGTERVHQDFPLRLDLLLIVTRTGRDYRPCPRQRIEQVARKGSPSGLTPTRSKPAFKTSLKMLHRFCRHASNKLRTKLLRRVAIWE